MRAEYERDGWAARLRGRARTGLDLVFPRQCAGCGAALAAGEGPVCWPCLSEVPRLSAPFCSVCGKPVAGRVDHAYTCAACLRMPPPFACARSAVYYRDLVRVLIAQVKYHHAVWLIPVLGDLLEASVRAWLPEGTWSRVVPVPLHPARGRERGFNQSALLARDLARRLGLPVAAGVVRRIRPTETQTHLTAVQRLTNVKSAFRADAARGVTGEDLLLVDDVMTTGATVAACARALRAAGAASVTVVTVARSG